MKRFHFPGQRPKIGRTIKTSNKNLVVLYKSSSFLKINAHLTKTSITSINLPYNNSYHKVLADLHQKYYYLLCFLISSIVKKISH